MSLSKSKWTLLKLQLEFELEKYDIAFYSILQNDRSTLLMEKSTCLLSGASECHLVTGPGVFGDASSLHKC